MWETEEVVGVFMCMRLVCYSVLCLRGWSEGEVLGVVEERTRRQHGAGFVDSFHCKIRLVVKEQVVTPVS